MRNQENSKVNIKVHYLNGEVLNLENYSFLDSIKKVFNYSGTALKIVFPTTGKILYFEKNIFYDFINDGISQQELIEKTQCDELCRSLIELQSSSGDTIEPDTLFLKRKNIYVLADDDNYVEINSNNHSEIFKTI